MVARFLGMAGPALRVGHMVGFTRIGFVAFSVEKVRTVRNGCQRRTSGRSHKKREGEGEQVKTFSQELLG
jgi:hypothetical protein